MMNWDYSEFCCLKSFWYFCEQKYKTPPGIGIVGVTQIPPRVLR